MPFALEHLDHLPDAGDVLRGVLNQPMPRAKLVTCEGGWLFQLLVEPGSQLV